MKGYKINELKGEALRKALGDTKEAENFGDEVTDEDLICYNLMTGAVYDEAGNFLDYLN